MALPWPTTAPVRSAVLARAATSKHLPHTAHKSNEFGRNDPSLHDNFSHIVCFEDLTLRNVTLDSLRGRRRARLAFAFAFAFAFGDVVAVSHGGLR